MKKSCVSGLRLAGLARTGYVLRPRRGKKAERGNRPLFPSFAIVARDVTKKHLSILPRAEVAFKEALTNVPLVHMIVVMFFFRMQIHDKQHRNEEKGSLSDKTESTYLSGALDMAEFVGRPVSSFLPGRLYERLFLGSL